MFSWLLLIPKKIWLYVGLAAAAVVFVWKILRDAKDRGRQEVIAKQMKEDMKNAKKANDIDASIPGLSKSERERLLYRRD